MIPDLLESEVETASAFSTVARLRDGGLIDRANLAAVT